MTQIPENFASDGLESLDGRTRLAKAVRKRLNALVADLGGNESMTYQQRCLAKRAVWLETVIETQEAALARGEKTDQDRLTQSVNTLARLLKMLGVEKPRRSPASVPRAAAAT